MSRQLSYMSLAPYWADSVPLPSSKPGIHSLQPHFFTRHPLKNGLLGSVCSLKSSLSISTASLPQPLSRTRTRTQPAAQAPSHPSTLVSPHWRRLMLPRCIRPWLLLSRLPLRHATDGMVRHVDGTAIHAKDKR